MNQPCGDPPLPQYPVVGLVDPTAVYRMGDGSLCDYRGIPLEPGVHEESLAQTKERNGIKIAHAGRSFGPDDVQAVIEERGKVYGDPLESHTNIGLSWTAMLQQHYGITLDHPIPPEVVALMMVVLKAQRSAKVYKDDNYVDLKIYAGFAEDFQKKRA